jgi:hypothetical protein
MRPALMQGKERSSPDAGVLTCGVSVFDMGAATA